MIKAREVYSPIALNKGALCFQDYTEVTNMSLVISTEMLARASGKSITEGWSIVVHSGHLQVRQAVFFPTGKQHAVPHPTGYEVCLIGSQTQAAGGAEAGSSLPVALEGRVQLEDSCHLEIQGWYMCL